MNEVSHVVFDVDDVLMVMDAPTRTAEDSMRVPLGAALGDARAVAVLAAFRAAYAVLIDQLRRPPGHLAPAYVALRARIDHWQRGVTAAGFEIKQWSRDCLLAIALEDAGVRPRAELVGPTVDHYFAVLASNSHPYPDAAELVAVLRRARISFHLATNSDGFMRLQGDTFVYDPADAVERKLSRLRALESLGITRDAITVGDPIGKPAPAFYGRVLAEFEARLDRPLDLARTLAIGDSLTSDVLPLLALGVGHGAWLRRDGSDAPTPPGVHVIRTLAEVA